MKSFVRFFIIPYLLVFFTCVSSQPAFCFTVGEEREVGEKLLYTVRSSFKILDEPDLHQYIAKLGQEVINVAGVQFFDYHFFVIKNKEFNAFAAPSGLIFFHTGLIETMNSEDELISVMAHEIGHVVKRHISSKIDKSKKVSLATLGLVLASLALGNGTATQAVLTGSLAAGQSTNLHFSRLDEEEADLLAYGWMKDLKRNPDAQVRMLQTMRQIARYRAGIVPQYLLTHPNPESRLDYVQSLIASEEDELKSMLQSENFDFLRFKFRVMSETKEATYLRGYYSSIISNSRSTDHDIVMAKYGLSQLDRMENNYVYSLELMNEVIAHFPEKNILLVDKGIIQYESGDAQQAFKTLTLAYDKDRADAYAAFALARVSFNLGLIAKAETLNKSVMYEMPEFSKVYFELGRIGAAKGSSAETSYYLGKYYLYEGKLRLSLKNLTAASQHKDLPKELMLDAKRSIDLIENLER